MPIDPNDLLTGGALKGALAASLLRQRERASELAPGARIGAYRIERELGRGGMAIVYLAARDDGEYEQQIALKWMLQAHPDDAGAALFRRERQALADLRHPHIARLLDGGRTEDGRPWFAMELIEGEPLDRHCGDRALPLQQRLDLFLQVCSAVAFAHARGMLHRDIKPSNVLVDGESSARLLDFGIAQMLGQDEAPATRAYTPGFASPEQVRGDALTVASDIFQLGRLLETVLDARPGTVANTSTTLASKPPATPAPPAVQRDWPEDIHAIVAKATTAGIATRYATVEALADDVRAHLAWRPVAARGRGRGYVLSRYLRRHRVAAGILGAAAVVLLGAALAFVWQLRIERDTAAYQAKVATSVLDFLRQDLLAAADPAAAPGRELSVREALDLASAAAATRFADLPAEQGAIRTTLADLYDQLGRIDDAEREAKLAMTLAQAPGARADQLAAARWSMANVRVAQGHYVEAQALHEQVLAFIRSEHGEYSRDWFAIRSEQAFAQHMAGDYEAAGEVHQELLKQARARFGADDALTLNISSALADDHMMRGQQQEALALLEPVYARWQTLLGPLHPRTLAAAHQIGTLHRHLGDAELALTWLQRAIDGRLQTLGPEHPETLLSLNEQATALQELKRYDAAEPVFRQVLEARTRLLGEAHPRTRNSMSNLGLLYSLWEKPELAAPLYERTLALDLEQGGENHPDTIALMHNIAGLYRKQGRFDDALKMHERAIESGRRALGEDAWQVAAFMSGYGITLDAAGRQADALATLDQAIALFDRTLGPEHQRSQRAREIRAGIAAPPTP